MLNETEKEAWKSFAAVVNGFLGNHVDDNYADLVANLVKSYDDMGCRISMKVHMLDAHLNERTQKNMENASIKTLRILNADTKDNTTKI